MPSPLGTRFKVINCVMTSDTRVTIKGTQLQHDNHEHDKIPDASIIADGFTNSAIGWDITFMPGHAPRPPTTYVDQLSQPPLYAKVD